MICKRTLSSSSIDTIIENPISVKIMTAMVLLFAFFLTKATVIFDLSTATISETKLIYHYACFCVWSSEKILMLFLPVQKVLFRLVLWNLTLMFEPKGCVYLANARGLKTVAQRSSVGALSQTRGLGSLFYCKSRIIKKYLYRKQISWGPLGT